MHPPVPRSGDEGGTAPSYFAFAVSMVLALMGMLVAIGGIVGEEWKAVLAGLVLLMGAGVFATLCLATRRRAGDGELR